MATSRSMDRGGGLAAHSSGALFSAFVVVASVISGIVVVAIARVENTGNKVIIELIAPDERCGDPLSKAKQMEKILIHRLRACRTHPSDRESAGKEWHMMLAPICIPTSHDSAVAMPFWHTLLSGAGGPRE